MSKMFKLTSTLEKLKQGSTKRVQLFRPEDGLTREQKERIEKCYRDKCVKVTFGKQLEIIRVYDQGDILAYDCTNNKEKAIILVASVYEDGDRSIELSAVCSEIWFNELMENDTDTIQNIAVKVFPTLYRVPQTSKPSS